jgi:hypothetical protein
MAVERAQKILTLNLGELVSQQSTLLTQFKKGLQYQDETEFQKRVLQDGISYGAQREYRKAQLEKEKKSKLPDQEFIRTLTNEVSNLGKLTRWQKWNDDFQKSYDAWKLGRQSADDHLNYLESYLQDITDDELKDTIENQISSTQQQIKTDYRSLVDSRLKLAQEDGTISALQKAIQEAETEKGKALLEKDELRSTAMDSVIMTLQRNMRQTQMASDLLNIDLKVYGGADIDEKLNFLSDKANTAPIDEVPIKVGDTLYPNERSFWDGQLSSFITGTYLGQKEKDMVANLTSTYNKLGDMPMDTILDYKSKLDLLATNPSLANYADKLLTLKQNVLGEAIKNKMTKMSETLQTDDTKEAILKIKDEIMSLQQSVPEISQSGAYHELELSFATKQRAELEKRQSLLTGAKAQELETAKEIIQEKYETGELEETDYNKKMEEIAKQSNELAMFKTNLEMTDIPASTFGFGTDIGQLYSESIKNYPGISQPFETGVETTPATKTAIAGIQQQKEVAQPKEVTQPAKKEKQPEPVVDPWASIRTVFGPTWQPATAFSEKGLTKKGIYGAVRVAGTPDVYTIGPGGTKETAETYLQKFGSAEQKGIVGEVSADQARKLGIKV